MTSQRYLAVFLFPTIAALFLHFGTFSLMEAANQESRELFDRLASANAETRTAMLLERAERDEFTLNSWLYWIFGGSIIFTGILSGLLIPVTSTGTRAVNMLTVLVAGFCTAKIAIGFSHMRWTEFSGWLCAAILCAAVVVLLRWAFRNRAILQ